MVLASIVGSVLVFIGAMATIIVQQRNLRKRAEEAKALRSDDNIVAVIETLQRQINVNYEAWQKAESARSSAYEQLLKQQDKYRDLREYLISNNIKFPESEAK